MLVKAKKKEEKAYLIARPKKSDAIGVQAQAPTESPFQPVQWLEESLQLWKAEPSLPPKQH